MPAERGGGGARPRVRLLGGGPRRWRWLALGVAMMAGGGLVAGAAAERIDDRTAVLVAAADLPAGHVLAADDLNIAELGGTGAAGVSTVSGDRLEEAVGHPLSVPLTEGAVLPGSALGTDAAYPPSGEAVVGAALLPGRYPPSLRPGAQVSAVVADASSDAAPATGENAGRTFPARLQSFAPAADGGPAVAELLVDAGDAAPIATAAAAERLSIVQVAPRGGG